jgi:hypothetical protein
MKIGFFECFESCLNNNLGLVNNACNKYCKTVIVCDTGLWIFP